jgi:predicted RNA-binding protein YlqC (UPF0109 family)
MKDILLPVIRGMVSSPRKVDITETRHATTVFVEIKVEPDDCGKIIGGEGKVIKAIRVIAHSISMQRYGLGAQVEIIDPRAGTAK